MNLKILRRKIDQIDLKILNLLTQRAKYSLKIAELKKDSKINLYSPERVAEVINNIRKHNPGIIPDDILEPIFNQITSISLAISGKLKVAYLGPQASFTHLAAIKKFGEKADFISCDNISEVFNKVENKEAYLGVVPIENSIEGVVNHTLDMFITHRPTVGKRSFL